MIFQYWLIGVLCLVLEQHFAASENKKYVVCYHGTWSTYRQSLGKYDVTDIDPFLCTHVMYAFFGVEDNGELRVIDPYLDLEDNFGRGNIKKFNALKLKNPTLKTLAAVGGWNEGSKNFSIVANDPAKRSRFVQSTVKFIQKHGFDGLDLDWEYPNQRHNLTNDDRNNFISLLKELKEGLQPFGYMLTAAVGSAEFSASLSYIIPEVVKYLDIINVMAYDLHGFWDDTIGINAPLYAGPMDETTRAKQLNVHAVMKYWTDQGAPRDKLVIGVPFYGRSFTLQDANKHTPGSPHIGRGIGGQYSQEPGVIGYNELCEKMQQEQWNIEWESTQMVPYAYRERQWVGFETPRSIALKAQYVMDNDYAGVMIWSIESDDFLGNCGEGKYPLLNQINQILYGTTATGMTSDTTEQKVPSPQGPAPVSPVPKNPNVSNLWDLVCHAKNGYVRDTDNCSKFYLCENGITHSFSCPSSLKFDLKISSCNYPQNVQC